MTVRGANVERLSTPQITVSPDKVLTFPRTDTQGRENFPTNTKEVGEEKVVMYHTYRQPHGPASMSCSESRWDLLFLQAFGSPRLRALLVEEKDWCFSRGQGRSQRSAPLSARLPTTSLT